MFSWLRDIARRFIRNGKEAMPRQTNDVFERTIDDVANLAYAYGSSSDLARWLEHNWTPLGEHCTYHIEWILKGASSLEVECYQSYQTEISHAPDTVRNDLRSLLLKMAPNTEAGIEFSRNRRDIEKRHDNIRNIFNRTTFDDPLIFKDDQLR